MPWIMLSDSVRASTRLEFNSVKYRSVILKNLHKHEELSKKRIHCFCVTNIYIYEMTTSYSWWEYCICYLEYTFLLGYFYSAPQKKKEENHAYIGEAYRILERAPSSCATRSKRRPRRSTKDGYSVWLTSLSQPKSTNICYLKLTYCYSRPINKSAVVQKHRQIFQLEIL
jgi:hypothetical protein